MDALDDARPLDLDRDQAPIAQPRPVHLCQRGAAQRGFLEIGERLPELEPERLFDRGPDLGERQRRHVVLDALQRGQVRGRDHVRTGRQRLADLDEGRPQRLQVGDEFLRAAGRRRRGGRCRGIVQVQSRKHAGPAVLEQESQDLGGAGEAAGSFVGHGRESVWKPQPRATHVMAVQARCRPAKKKNPPRGGFFGDRWNAGQTCIAFATSAA